MIRFREQWILDVFRLSFNRNIEILLNFDGFGEIWRGWWWELNGCVVIVSFQFNEIKLLGSNGPIGIRGTTRPLDNSH